MYPYRKSTFLTHLLERSTRADIHGETYSQMLALHLTQEGAALMSRNVHLNKKWIADFLVQVSQTRLLF
jgi:hypothetical protein